MGDADRVYPESECNADVYGMTNKKGNHPFGSCPVMTPAQQLRGLYQVGFFESQLLDAFFNVDSYALNISVIQDPTDGDIALTEAGADALAAGLVVPGGALAGLGIGLDLFLGGGSSVGMVGNTTRQACPLVDYITGKPYLLCRDLQFEHVYFGSLSMWIMDFGATVRKQFGQGNHATDWLYFPRTLWLSYLSGYFCTNDQLLFSGAGTLFGGITMDSSATGGISTAEAVTSQGPPVGSPSLLGSVTVNTRYDNLVVAPALNSQLKFSGVPFTGVPALPLAPNEGLFLGDQQTTFKTQADGSILAAVPAGFKKDYATFRASAPNSNVWSSRILVSV